MEKTKSFLTFEEMEGLYANRPKRKFLWNGIKENSFGLIFGPAKSGKTILCENLALSIAAGETDYLGYTISGGARKVLFVSLEEFWEDRFERNLKQVSELKEEKQLLIKENFFYQEISFKDKITESEDWRNLRNLIIDTEAKVVFIDSITRMNYAKLEDGAVAEKIMQNLRNICHECGITLIVVHHTRKLGEEPITMDSLKGSSVFAQESDFAIAVRNTSKNHRYMKNIFFRYSSCNDELVKEIEIDDTIWLNSINECEEDDILRRTDRRRSEDKRNMIIDYFDSQTTTAFNSKDIVDYFTGTFSIKQRQVKSYLSNLVQEEKILSPSRGVYTSVHYNKNLDERN